MALPIEEPAYDPATHCSRAPRPGMITLEHWLERNARGSSWGTVRCEQWRRQVDRTVAHRDHVHLGLTRAGAAKRMSFWKHDRA